MRDQDELICLGFGGARYNVVSQYYATGGIVLRVNGVQVHVDPGPSAGFYAQLARVNPEQTRLLLVTHDHTDHANDVPVILEAMHEGDMSRQIGTLIAPVDLVERLGTYYRGLLQRIISLKPNETCTVKGQPDFQVLATPSVHDDRLPCSGFKIYAGDYCIGFTGDTEVFPLFAKIYRDCDLLVCNLLRPESYHCDRHMTTNEVLPYLEALRRDGKLKAVVLAHFGARWGSDRMNPMIAPQLQKIKARLGCPVFPAALGVRTKVADLLHGVEPPYSLVSLKVKILDILQKHNYFAGPG